MSDSVHLGFEVGTGNAVEIPIAHTFVTGQTQLSGKTTTLRAIVERSCRTALAFVTKRGETFEGRRIPPYLPREGDQPIHWRLVETILASALGQRSMKYERIWLINAVKRPRVATTLSDVRDNIDALLVKAKDRSAEAYTLIGEYLDLVLPEMRELGAVDTLNLEPGLNVMDLAGVGLQLQSLVIRAALERINQRGRDILTVFPEAWEFAPRGRAAPAKDEAIAMARKGAVLGNFLLCDSQDIAGVETVVRQAASVWILGVQRELNELKRTIQMIPAGIKRPKPEDVATLELGQFYACWGRHAVKTYVQPPWMLAPKARQVALGHVSARDQRPAQVKEDEVNATEAEGLKNENAQLRRDNAELRRRLDDLESVQRGDRTSDREGSAGGSTAPRDRAGVRASSPPSASHGSDGQGTGSSGPSAVAQPASKIELNGLEAAYKTLLARLVTDAAKDPMLLRVIATRPELELRVERKQIEVSEDSTRGMVAKLIADGFFDEGRSSASTLKELQRRGRSLSPGTLYPELDKLAEMGFFRIEDGKDDRGRPRKEYHLVTGMRVNVLEA